AGDIGQAGVDRTRVGGDRGEQALERGRGAGLGVAREVGQLADDDVGLVLGGGQAVPGVRQGVVELPDGCRGGPPTRMGSRSAIPWMVLVAVERPLVMLPSRLVSVDPVAPVSLPISPLLPVRLVDKVFRLVPPRLSRVWSSCVLMVAA